MPYVLETVRLLVGELDVPLIGFAGGAVHPGHLPDRGVRRSRPRPRPSCTPEPALWADLFDRLADIVLASLRAQVEAGAAAVQLFDSWAGVLAPGRLPPPRAARHPQGARRAGRPRRAPHPLRRGHRRAAGGHARGGGRRGRRRLAGAARPGPAAASVPTSACRATSTPPCAWPPGTRRRPRCEVLDANGGRPGHVFNLGHGVLPETDPDILDPSSTWSMTRLRLTSRRRRGARRRAGHGLRHAAPPRRHRVLLHPRPPGSGAAGRPARRPGPALRGHRRHVARSSNAPRPRRRASRPPSDPVHRRARHEARAAVPRGQGGGAGGAGRTRASALVLAPHYSFLSVGQYAERASAAGAAHGVEILMVDSWHTAPGYLDLLAGFVGQAIASLPRRSPTSRSSSPPTACRRSSRRRAIRTRASSGRPPSAWPCASPTPAGRPPGRARPAPAGPSPGSAPTSSTVLPRLAADGARGAQRDSHAPASPNGECHLDHPMRGLDVTRRVACRQGARERHERHTKLVVRRPSGHERAGCETIQGVDQLEIETEAGPARAHLHPAGAPRGALVLGHGAGGGVEAPDLVAATEAALEADFSVALVEQPYRVAGKRSSPAPKKLDPTWVTVVEQLSAGELGGLPLVVGGRSAGARVACRTASDSGAVGVLCLAFPLQPPARKSGATSPSRLDELEGVDGAGARRPGRGRPLRDPARGRAAHGGPRLGRPRSAQGPRGDRRRGPRLASGPGGRRRAAMSSRLGAGLTFERTKRRRPHVQGRQGIQRLRRRRRRAPAREFYGETLGIDTTVLEDGNLLPARPRRRPADADLHQARLRPGHLHGAQLPGRRRRGGGRRARRSAASRWSATTASTRTRRASRAARAARRSPGSRTPRATSCPYTRRSSFGQAAPSGAFRGLVKARFYESGVLDAYHP